MSYVDVSDKMSNQYMSILSIPSRVLSNWPSAVSFAIVDYITVMVLSLVPAPTGGSAGAVSQSLLRGTRDVVKMVTWDVTRTSGA